MIQICLLLIIRLQLDCKILFQMVRQSVGRIGEAVITINPTKLEFGLGQSLAFFTTFTLNLFLFWAILYLLTSIVPSGVLNITTVASISSSQYSIKQERRLVLKIIMEGG